MSLFLWTPLLDNLFKANNLHQVIKFTNIYPPHIMDMQRVLFSIYHLGLSILIGPHAIAHSVAELFLFFGI